MPSLMRLLLIVVSVILLGLIVGFGFLIFRDWATLSIILLRAVLLSVGVVLIASLHPRHSFRSAFILLGTIGGLLTFSYTLRLIDSEFVLIALVGVVGLLIGWRLQRPKSMP